MEVKGMRACWRMRVSAYPQMHVRAQVQFRDPEIASKENTPHSNAYRSQDYYMRAHTYRSAGI